MNRSGKQILPRFRKFGGRLVPYLNPCPVRKPTREYRRNRSKLGTKPRYLGFCADRTHPREAAIRQPYGLSLPTATTTLRKNTGHENSRSVGATDGRRTASPIHRSRVRVARFKTSRAQAPDQGQVKRGCRGPLRKTCRQGVGTECVTSGPFADRQAGLC